MDCYPHRSAQGYHDARSPTKVIKLEYGGIFLTGDVRGRDYSEILVRGCSINYRGKRGLRGSEGTSNELRKMQKMMFHWPMIPFDIARLADKGIVLILLPILTLTLVTLIAIIFPACRNSLSS